MAMETRDAADGQGLPDVTGLLLSTEGQDGFLTDLAEFAMNVAPMANGCGLTLERQGRPVTVTSAGHSAPKLDEAQYAQDDGPCLQAGAAQEFADDLQDALRSRAVIDRAIGVIMAQQGCGPGRAFDLLRAASQHRNVKLREVCAQLVARYGDHGDEPALRQRP
jgi:hypothetical protein